MKGIDTWGKLEEIKDIEWDKTVYKKTEVKVGNPVLGLEPCKVVMRERVNDSGAQEAYMIRYPELNEMGGTMKSWKVRPR